MSKKRVMKNFSDDEEELIRKFIFTNPHGDVSFIYPQELINSEDLSPLMSAYSRTHAPMQERVLKFLDEDKLAQTKQMLPHMKELIDIFRNEDGSLKLSAKTVMFNKEYPLLHGHASIKEETGLFGYCENISDIAGKKITGHSLNKPQVKSSRYISFGKVLGLSLEDPDILSLKNNDEFFEHIAWMNNGYLKVSEQLTNRVFNTPSTKKVLEYLRRNENVELAVKENISLKKYLDSNFNPVKVDYDRETEKVKKSLEDDNAKRDIEKFVLDYSRVYLLAVTRTSMGYSVDARTLEEICSDLISSSRAEDLQKGIEIRNEAKKIAPVLLGEEGHIEIDKWKVNNRNELRGYIEEKFKDLPIRKISKGAVKLLHPRNIDMYSDRFNAALIAFQYSDLSLLDIIGNLKDNEVNNILKIAHEHRNNYDVLHPAISHGGLSFELVMGYHGYRDVFRHRRGSRTNQLLTTRLGFEIPEIFKVLGINKLYLEDMNKCEKIYEKARKQDVYIAEKLVPFGANCRTLYSWQPNQIGYFCKLRGDISKGNSSYVSVARELAKAVEEVMPETAKYLKISDKEYPPELWKRGYGWYDAEGKSPYADGIG